MIAESSNYVENKAQQLATVVGQGATREKVVIAISEQIPVMAAQREAVISRALELLSGTTVREVTTAPVQTNEMRYHISQEVRSAIRRYITDERTSKPKLKCQEARQAVNARFSVEIEPKNFYVTYWNRAKPGAGTVAEGRVEKTVKHAETNSQMVNKSAQNSSEPQPVPPPEEEGLAVCKAEEPEFFTAKFIDADRMHVRMDVIVPITVGAEIIAGFGRAFMAES